jgi:UDP-glucose 4-epimerase
MQLRDFIYVGDVVDANLQIMKSNTNEIFLNVGTGTTTSINELAKMIIEISGLNVKPIHIEALEGDVKISQADISLIRRTIPWEPKVKLRDWLQQHIKKDQNKGKFDLQNQFS